MTLCTRATCLENNQKPNLIEWRCSEPFQVLPKVDELSIQEVTGQKDDWGGHKVEMVDQHQGRAHRQNT